MSATAEAVKKVKPHICRGIVLTRTWETQDVNASFWNGQAPILKHSAQTLVCKICGKKLAEASR